MRRYIYQIDYVVVMFQMYVCKPATEIMSTFVVYTLLTVVHCWILYTGILL